MREDAIAEAERTGLRRLDREAGPFLLATWRRPSPGHPRLSVYVEGDGYAWATRSRPSADPTPRAPVALGMAARETRGSVLYVARPCQFVTSPACSPDVWTRNRFSTTVVQAVAEAIEAERRAVGAVEVHLTGYSGGGIVAALVAARLDSVAGLVTVAAPLDVDAWTRHHGVSPVDGDRPMAAAARLRDVAQLHLVGGEDRIVPAEMVSSYLSAVRPTCAEMRIIPQFDHHCCWERLPPPSASCP